MAKFEAADPRWIVQERADGTNVNRWHWTEKDCLSWARQRLEQLFAGLQLVDAPGRGSARATGLKSVDGDCFLNVRKAKIVPSYELNIQVAWEGEAAQGQARGTIHLPYLAEENHDEDPEVRITTDASGKAAQALKELLLAEGKQVVLSKVNQFLKELRAGGPMQGGAAGEGEAAAAANGRGGSSVAKAGSGPEGGAPSTGTPAQPQASTSGAAGAAAAPADRDGRKGPTLKRTERFYARPSDIFEVFTHEGRVRAFSQSDARVEAREGGAFSWFGGAVSGKFTELQAPTRIGMRWRFSSWKDNCYSQVIMDLSEPEPGNTVLTLRQAGIPAADRFGNEGVLDTVEKGWEGQVFNRIRQVFGYGV